MNKRAKKILFLLFTAVFCFAIALPSIFAVPSQSVSPEVFSAYEIEAGLVPETSANEATDGEKTTNSDIVCVMRIYSDPGIVSFSPQLSMDFGHSFLTFLNVSSSDITVGRHTVAPNQMISVGKFGNLTDYAGGFKGVFYNIESHRSQALGWYATGRSIFMDLTASELNTISACIKQMQAGYIEVGNNCATFAGLVWNSILPSDHAKYIDHVGTPSLIYQDMEGIGGYDKILVGFPIWWFGCPQLIKTFMESYDFDGKKVYPFCTHGGSGPKNSTRDIKAICPGADVKDCFDATKNLNEAAVKEWLK